MGLTWDQYTGVYYGIQVGSPIIIYIILTILIPYDLIDWIIKTIFFMKKVKKEDTDMSMEMENNEQDLSSPPDCAKCHKIWLKFHKFFECECCQAHACCVTSKDVWEKVEEFYDSTCRRDKIARDLKNKHLSNHEVTLQREYRQWYCGHLIHLNMNKVGIYSLLSTCVWCASIAFFEAVILSYTAVGNGDTTCPTPKRGTDATKVDCFSYQNSFDTTPRNKTYPIQCNRTTPLLFPGDWAGCFALIYADVEVVDVIEQLGICSGIIAFIGSTVAMMGYLCRKHQWRLIFDILACLAIAAIPVLIEKRGGVPFLTYILLISLSGTIAITEYLLGYVPLLTGLCIAETVYQHIKTWIELIKNLITSSNETDHNLET